MNLSKDKGSAAIEMAIVLPLLLAVVFGIVDFGVAFYNKTMLTKSSREGARFGAVFRTPRPSDEDIILRSKQALEKQGGTEGDFDLLISFVGSPSVDVSVEYDDSDPDSRYIEVTSSYTHSYLFLPAITELLNAATPGSPFPKTVNLGSTTTMRIE